MPPAGTRGLTTALLIRSLCWCEDRLLMTTVVLVAVDLARLTVLLAINLGALLWVQFAAVRTFFASAYASSYASNVARELIYRGALDAISASPLVGYGFGSTAAVMPRFVPVGQFGIPSPLEDAHNIFLGVALWAGIPFAGLVISAIFLGALRVRRQGVHQPWSLAALAILINGVFDSPLTSLPHTSLYMVTIAAALLVPAVPDLPAAPAEAEQFLGDVFPGAGPRSVSGQRSPTLLA